MLWTLHHLTTHSELRDSMCISPQLKAKIGASVRVQQALLPSATPASRTGLLVQVPVPLLLLDRLPAAVSGKAAEDGLNPLVLAIMKNLSPSPLPPRCSAFRINVSLKSVGAQEGQDCDLLLKPLPAALASYTGTSSRSGCSTLTQLLLTAWEKQWRTVHVLRSCHPPRKPG